MKGISRVELERIQALRKQPRAIAISQAVHDPSSGNLVKAAVATATTLLISLGFAAAAFAETTNPTLNNQPAVSTQEVDTSITRDYEPATVYVHDTATHELVPRSVLVVSDQPVEGAVGEIIQSYEGQDVGIQGYEVSVDSSAQEAEINFEIAHPRGADALQSLSSANQYSLFEAIRETLLTQPEYDIERVNFLANGRAFDI